MTVDGDVCREFGPNLLQFRFLLEPGDRDVAAPPDSDALLQGRVVGLAAGPQGVLKVAFLFRRRLALGLEGLSQLAHGLPHGYCSPFCRCSRRTYVCSAHTNSFVKER